MPYVKTTAEAVRAFEGTGFKLLDFSFYNMNNINCALASGDWKREISDAGDAAAELRMSFCQAHSPDFNCLAPNISCEDYELGILLTARAIEGCGMLGIGNIVVHSGYADGLGKAEYFRLNRDFYRRLLPAAEKFGVNICIENSAEMNMGGKYFFMEADEMNEFINYMQSPRVKACWDTGHANMRHMDQYATIMKLGKNLSAIHIQDNFGKYDQHIAPYQGTTDFKPIVKALLDSGYTGYFTFESSNMLKKPASIELKRLAVRLLYATGVEMLSGFNCFEY